MANEPERSTTGVYFDSDNDKVVTDPPERGVQIVPPGGEVDAAAKAEIESYRSLSGVEVDEAVVDEKVDTTDDPPVKSTRATKK